MTAYLPTLPFFTTGNALITINRCSPTPKHGGLPKTTAYSPGRGRGGGSNCKVHRYVMIHDERRWCKISFFSCIAVPLSPERSQTWGQPPKSRPCRARPLPARPFRQAPGRSMVCGGRRNYPLPLRLLGPWRRAEMLPL